MLLRAWSHTSAAARVLRWVVSGLRKVASGCRRVVGRSKSSTRATGPLENSPSATSACARSSSIVARTLCWSEGSRDHVSPTLSAKASNLRWSPGEVFWCSDFCLPSESPRCIWSAFRSERRGQGPPRMVEVICWASTVVDRLRTRDPAGMRNFLGASTVQPWGPLSFRASPLVGTTRMPCCEQRSLMMFVS